MAPKSDRQIGRQADRHAETNVNRETNGQRQKNGRRGSKRQNTIRNIHTLKITAEEKQIFFRHAYSESYRMLSA